MSERPVSSHSHYLLPPNSIYTSNQFDVPMPREGKFQSSFARCLNMPSMAMDQLSWLENELLDTRQVKAIIVAKIVLTFQYNLVPE